MTDGLEAIVTKKSSKPKKLDISGLTEEELQLVDEGKQNYGEEAFMEHVLPVYLAIKKKHGFPSNCLKRVVNFPLEIDRKYQPSSGVITPNEARKIDYECKPSLGTIAASVGKKLQDYEKILDHNKKLLVESQFKPGARYDVILAKLSEVKKELCHSRYRAPCSR